MFGPFLAIAQLFAASGSSEWSAKSQADRRTDGQTGIHWHHLQPSRLSISYAAVFAGFNAKEGE